MSVQAGEPWGGLGIRVATRGYQWNNQAAQDIVFWEYEIDNISDYDIPDMIFGFWIDSGIGDGNDDLFASDTLSMVYAWDVNGVGNFDLQTPCAAFALLESASRADDNLDNDNDGLIDEKRDNTSFSRVGPYDGIADLNKFLAYYNLTEADLHEHWIEDEDQDWRDGVDTNGNGVYDPNEFCGDDVGLDGKGPNDINYPGPDEGECNHRPDYAPGLGCEPNFAVLDVDESDMIGMTSCRMFPPAQHIPPFENWFRHKNSCGSCSAIKNIVPTLTALQVFTSLFQPAQLALKKIKKEFISMAILHSFADGTQIKYSDDIQAVEDHVPRFYA